MAESLVKDYAEKLKIPVDRLLAQLADAGIEQKSAGDPLSEEEKSQLLGHLRRAHGGGDGGETSPRRVTLRRRVTEELPQTAGGRTRPTAGASRPASKVQVTVRRKRTYVKREDLEQKALSEAASIEQARKEREAALAAAAERTRQAREAAEAQERAEKERAEKELAEQERQQKEREAAEAAAQPAVVETVTQPESAASASEAVAVAPPAPAADKAVPKKQRGKPGGRHDAGPGRREKLGKNIQPGRRKSATRAVPRKAKGSGRHGFEQPVEFQQRRVSVGETISVADLAASLAVKAGEVIKCLMGMGQMVTINEVLDQDTAILVAEELGHIATPAVDENPELRLQTESAGQQQPRPPVVTVMGHVDHGKTTLLDYIREARVAAGESGGITQHIGAYHVETSQGAITFLDTPGHAAFSAMRARGARVTDLVVLVVAADDGVMPQTIEAIQHAKASGVPLIVAVNKMDIPDADPERVKSELAGHEVTPEEWGGDTIFVPLSAKTGEGVDNLLESIALQAELLELTASAEGPANGVVIESRLDRGRGPVATVLVQSGTLRKGDLLLAGNEFGRVRLMLDDLGQAATEAGPSMPVEVQGLSGVPEVGDPVNVVADERQAREVAAFRRQRQREAELTDKRAASEEDLFARMDQDEQQLLNVIVKADVKGSAEALAHSLQGLGSDEVGVRVIASGVGAITETDVNLAISTGARIIGFNVRADAAARKAIREKGVALSYHSVIYEAIDEAKAALTGMLRPEFAQQVLGLAEVRQVFRAKRYGAVAGCMVVEGTVTRNKPIRVLRDNVVIFEGELESLRRVAEDVAEVKAGTECGIAVKGYEDVREGDQIECYEQVQVARSL